MSAFLPLALTLLGAGVAFKAAPRIGLAVLFATVLLVPDTAFLRGSGFDNLPIYRIVLLAFVAGLVARVVRGEASADIFRPTRLHAAFGLWLAGAGILGIGLSQPGLGTEPRVQAILLVADQLVLFVAVVAAVRYLGDAWGVVKIVVAVFTAAVVIATAEQVLGWSYGRWVLSRPGLRLGVLGAQELEERGGDTRVRAAAQFALGYAWVGAILLPLTLAFVAQIRSRVLWALPALGAATILWTQSRSALPAMALGVVLVAVLSGFRRHLVLFVVVAALGTTAIYLTESSLREPFDSQSTRDSDRGREDRQAVGFDRASERPVIGHGLSSLTGRFRLHGLDLEYLKVYVEVGVLGLGLFVWLLVMALVTCGRGLRAPPGRHRAVAAATTTAMVLGVAAGAAYDFFSVPGSVLPLWMVVAIGTANADLVASARTDSSPVARLPGWRARAALPVGCLAIGLVVARAQDATTEWRAVFETLPVYVTATGGSDFNFVGKLISEDVCEIAAVMEPAQSSVSCRALGNSGGLGELVWRGATAAGVRDDAFATVATMRRAFPGFRAHPAAPEPSERHAVWARTAPWWMTLAGALLALFLPATLTRRRPSSEVEHSVLHAPR